MRLAASLAVLTLLVTPALADSLGPGGTWDPVLGSFGDYKTPPLASSDIFSVPISYHSTFAFTNWAGAILDIRYTDPLKPEAVFLGAMGRPPDGISPGGAGFMPTLSGMPGTAMAVTFWSNNWFNSGTTPASTVFGSSTPFPLGSLTFHATSTTTLNNSDIDITFSAWNIWHVVLTQSSQTWQVPASIWLYGPMDGVWEPTEPGLGVWWHNPTTYMTHVTQSMFWATTAWMSGQGSIGVEHVPEPAAAGMLLAGLGALVFARKRRV